MVFLLRRSADKQCLVPAGGGNFKEPCYLVAVLKGCLEVFESPPTNSTIKDSDTGVKVKLVWGMPL